MGRQFGIVVELAVPLGAAFGADDLPTLAAAVRAVTEQAHAQWTKFALGAPLPSGQVIHPRSGAYARSIQMRQLGAFAAEVYTELPYAEAIEQGTGARDMKKMLDSSLKVRVSKSGKRYLIIPFRHDTPDSQMGNPMPQAVHDWWHDKSASHIVGTFARLSGTGAYDRITRKPLTVPGWRYSWGDKLQKADLEGLGIAGPEAKRLAGMVNFRKPGGVGGGAHSQFITFRTMTEGSKGWVAKAVPGKWPARQTADLIRPVAEEAFGRAVEADIQRVLAAEPGKR